MKVLVIGNGYDLNLGLESSFGHFFNSFCKKEDDWDYTKIRSNIWRLLLFFKYINHISNGLIKFEKESPKWMDVEGFISEVLNHQNIIPFIEDSINDKIKHNQPSGKIFCSTKGDQLNEIKSYVQMRRDDFGCDNAYRLLFEDLELFEHDFISYLDRIVDYQYLIKSSNLMSKLSNNYQNTYVLSFNYTKLPDELKGINQVHGSIEENKIIIGVDKTSILGNDINKLRFSKSWRQLSGLLNSSKLPSKNDVDEIVVVGHSLGSQDYSYFHSLFNFYDIYGGKVKLTFLYADYHINKKTKLPDYEKNEESKTNYIDSVYKLLNNYVEKSLGKQESDSFVTKIQLEGRLSVKEINQYWAENIKYAHN